MGVTLRPAGWRDVFRLYRWRNDMMTRAMMVQTDAIGLVEHLTWFWRMRASGYDHGRGSRTFIGLVDGDAIGSGRLDLSGPVAEFDVIIAPGERGKGYGAGLIAALVAEACAQDCSRCRAVIRRQNIASRKAFGASGFRTLDANDRYYVMERAC